MEHGGPRSHDPLARRRAALAALALARHGLGRARVVQLRDGFKQVFRVDHPRRGRFVLRTYAEPPAEARARRDPRHRTGTGLRCGETLRAQLSWLSELRRRTGLPVPEPVPLSDGRLFGYVSFADLPRCRRIMRRLSAAHRDLYHPDHPGRRFALLRWVRGEPGRGTPSLADVARIGSFLARLHEYAGAYPRPPSLALPRWDWHWPFGGSAPLWDLGEVFYSAAEMAVLEETSRRVRRDLDRLGYGHGAFGVIHRDLTLKNLLFHDGTVGATDFDLSGFGHYPLDLAVVLRALTPGTTPADRTGRTLEALLEGYGRVRALPNHHLQSLPTFDAMQKVAAVNRTLDLRANTRQGRWGEKFLRNAVGWLRTNYLD